MSSKSTPTGRAPLVVWAEKRPEPDWDRFIAALVALAMRRVDGSAKSEKEQHD